MAALGVIWAHCYGGSGGDVLGDFSDRLISGVGFGGLVFFAMTGALLYLPFARRDFGGGGPVLLRNYALNRVLRIAPLYYVVLIVALVFLRDGGTFEQWWRFALFTESLTSEYAGRINGALWTTVVDIHFLILLPILAYLIARFARGSINRAMLFVAAIGLASIVFQVVVVLIPGRKFPDPVALSTPANFYFFTAGMLVPLLRERWKRQRPSWLRGRLGSQNTWVLASVPFWILFVSWYSLEPVFSIGCFLLLGACLLPLEPGRLMRGLDWRPLGLLGLTSYGIYLWHGPILKAIGTGEDPVFSPLFRSVQGLVGSDFVALFLVVTPVSCVVALVSYVLIEQPPLRLRRRWGTFRRLSRERPEGAPREVGDDGSAAAQPGASLARPGS